jgi:glycosyltransferase involved in cell wall biosynthesis
MSNNLKPACDVIGIGAQATELLAIDPHQGSSTEAWIQSPGPTKTTCLISNYNYRQYIADAIDSVLAQTTPLDEIIVVDDGSTDDSQEFIRRRYGHHGIVKLVAKKNEGQLSCFNEGFRRSTGDIIFFLDADDAYEKNYVEEALKVYFQSPGCDFLFTGYRTFHAPPGQTLNVDKTPTVSRGAIDLGFSVILSLYKRVGVGAPTSCLSMRRGLLEHVLPIPYLDDWRICADDCLNFGSSVMRGRKFFLKQPLVLYRIHDKNNFTGTHIDVCRDYQRSLRTNRLLNLLQRRAGFDVVQLPQLAAHEFRTIQKPTFSHLRRYMELTLAAHMPIARKLKIFSQLLGHYLAASMPASGSATGAP